MVRVPEAQSDCSCRGEAEVRILNFKTTWSEFQNSSQTATERGKAELSILNSKTKFRNLDTQTVAPNSIPLPLHVVLELNKHTLTLP